MTETEEIVELSNLSGEEKVIKKKTKKKGTPSWMSKWMEALKSGDFSEVNFRRKHPRLGNKISDIEIRLRKVERSMVHIKNLLSDDLKDSWQRKLLNEVDRDWEEILRSL